LVWRSPGSGWLVSVGGFVAVAVGTALLFALTGPPARAGAVAGALAAAASTAAALTAIYLSTRSLARTDQQLESTRRTTVLSRYPLLLPVHQSVVFPSSAGRLATHPPTEDRFELSSTVTGSYAFVADTSDRYVIPIENVGEGPALRIAGRLWRNDGTVGEVAGPSVLGAGRLAIMSATLCPADADAPAGFHAAIIAVDGPLGSTFFWLDLSYQDVFGNQVGARALFDSRGLGTWRHLGAECYSLP
jgi:hypothetical protein